jgi:hypothetical protein
MFRTAESSSRRSFSSPPSGLENPDVPPQDPQGDEDAGPSPTDISLVPDVLAADRGDAARQSELLREIIKAGGNPFDKDPFDALTPRPLKLSYLRSVYKHRISEAINVLCARHVVEVDEDLRLLMGTGQIHMDTTESTIDFQLTVANRIGLSPILPNAASAHRFGFDLDLKKDRKEFKGKHAMLGFDPAGCMLFVGRSNNEDVFLAMAPNEFVRGRLVPPPPAGRKPPSRSSCMSKRHYRQVVMMLTYFLTKLKLHPYIVLRKLYEQDLESDSPEFERVTDAL